MVPFHPIDRALSVNGGGWGPGWAAEHLLTTTRALKPYSRLTTWVRVSHFWSWLHPIKENPYATFKTSNPRLFTQTYERSKPDISYTQAILQINQIPCPHYRGWAMVLLQTGMRITESQNYEGGSVTGKGSKRRKVRGSVDGWNGVCGSRPYTLRRHLARVGLKPHDLRKVFATEVARRGANSFELCELMGWSSIETARSYIGVTAERAKEILPK